MAHQRQADWIKYVRKLKPEFFRGIDVLDVGSYDINGNNRPFFTDCDYFGVDLVDGRNVDMVGNWNELTPPKDKYDTLISTEMLEHDKQWEDSIRKMYEYVKPGGLLLITAAGTGRREHGTFASAPESSPATNDYYKNITNEMFLSVLPESKFTEHAIRQFETDFQFWGIKNS
jgi:SAM-dependent methyltransferase